MDGKSPERAYIRYIYMYMNVHNQCQVCLAAKYRNKTRLDNLAERNVAYNKKNHRTTAAQKNCFIFFSPRKTPSTHVASYAIRFAEGGCIIVFGNWSTKKKKSYIIMSIVYIA